MLQAYGLATSSSFLSLRSLFPLVKNLSRQDSRVGNHLFLRTSQDMLQLQDSMMSEGNRIHSLIPVCTSYCPGGQDSSLHCSLSSFIKFTQTTSKIQQLHIDVDTADRGEIYEMRCSQNHHLLYKSFIRYPAIQRVSIALLQARVPIF